MVDYSNFDDIKNLVLMLLIGMAVICLICVCGICGYMRTHKHIHQGLERKERSTDNLVETIEDPISNSDSPSENIRDEGPNYYRPTSKPVKSAHPNLENTTQETSLREKYLSQRTM
eukprot:NODE_693_length_5110_cov_0.285572.p6 type:complete len:116 gc:universal NODE_693_length_5110_cov_0.285572:274-621(+)